MRSTKIMLTDETLMRVIMTMTMMMIMIMIMIMTMIMMMMSVRRKIYNKSDV